MDIFIAKNTKDKLFIFDLTKKEIEYIKDKLNENDNYKFLIKYNNKYIEMKNGKHCIDCCLKKECGFYKSCVTFIFSLEGYYYFEKIDLTDMYFNDKYKNLKEVRL